MTDDFEPDESVEFSGVGSSGQGLAFGWQRDWRCRAVRDEGMKGWGPEFRRLGNNPEVAPGVAIDNDPPRLKTGRCLGIERSARS
ncbi:MAG TPA: hypothetical protein PJ986_14150 [Gammaproteobacteria bacterium]|nr:hypothetical protein [Gammaproteobacteria bacterium]